MSDHQHLDDAFAEYERRADAVGAARGSGASRPDRRSSAPLMLVAASVAVVLAVAGVVLWLAAASGTSDGSGRPAAGGPGPSATSTASRSPSATGTGPAVEAPVVLLPTRSGSNRPSSGPSVSPTAQVSTPTSVRSRPVGGRGVPANAAQMERAFRRVLGDTATVTVTEHDGNYIKGILTATSTGAKGGYDIQAVNGRTGDKPSCEDPGSHSHCTIVVNSDGGTLAVEREVYGGGKDVLYYVNYVFPNGANFAFHLSNRADPKGAGRTFGPKPPLTLKQMTSIIESDGWHQYN